MYLFIVWVCHQMQRRPEKRLGELRACSIRSKPTFNDSSSSDDLCTMDSASAERPKMFSTTSLKVYVDPW